MEGDSGKSAGGPKTIKASDFKAKCLKLMDEVAESGEAIIITKHGKPVAKLTPCERTPKTLFGTGGEIVMHDDLIEPVDVEWEAETDPDRVLNP